MVGYFVGNFFGLKDSWCSIKKDLTFLSKEQILDLFKDFGIIDFKENEYDGKTALGITKHWHTIDIIARKN